MTQKENKLSMEVAKEVEQGKYQSGNKNNCVWCNARIKDSIQRYVDKGNACDECMRRFNKILSGKRELVRDKKGKSIWKKYADYTTEEIKEMILARIEEVRIRGL